MEPAISTRSAEGGRQPRQRLVGDTASARHRGFQIFNKDDYEEKLRRNHDPKRLRLESPANSHDRAVPYPAPNSLSRHVRWQELPGYSSGIKGASASVDHLRVCSSKAVGRDSTKRGFPMFWKFSKKPVEHRVTSQTATISSPMPLRRRVHSDAPNPRR